MTSHFWTLLSPPQLFNFTDSAVWFSNGEQCLLKFVELGLQAITVVEHELPRQSIAEHVERELHYRFGHVQSMYRGSRLRSTSNTSYITGLGMWKVCTEAVDCGARWTRVTLQVWACVKCVPRQSIAEHVEHELHYRFGHVQSMYRSSRLRSTLNTSYITGLSMCKVCTEAVHSVECYMCAKTNERRKNSIFLHVANSSGSEN